MRALAQKVVVNGVALATASAIFLAAPTSAQEHRGIEIAPALGAFVPSGDVPFSFPPYADCPTLFCLWSYNETRTVAIGGRVTAWLGKRAAIEGSILYGPTGVAGIDHEDSAPPYPRYEGPGNVVLTSLRAVLNLGAPAPTLSVLLMAGPAVIHQFGGDWSDWKTPTSPGGVLGIGLDVHRGRGFACRAAVEDYIYSWESPMGASYGSHMHHDFVFSLSAGPSFFGGRGERR